PRRLPESTSPSSPSHCASSSLTSQVMRLRKPNLIPQLLPTLTSRPFTTSPISHLKDHAVIDPLLEGNGLSGVTELPNGFGSMFVGTNFSAYVCLNNESEDGVSEVCVKAEMRHLGSREVLVPRIVRVGIEEMMREESVSLQPHEALHQIIHQSTVPSRNDPIRRYPVSQVSIRPYFV